MIDPANMLEKYLTAEAAILEGQSVRFGERLLTMANLVEVQTGRKEWERRVASESRFSKGGSYPRYKTPDFT